MESVKLFYCVKTCDETNCFNNHIAKIYKIEDHIKSCFKTHLIRDKFLSLRFLVRSDRVGGEPYTIPRLGWFYSCSLSYV